MQSGALFFLAAVVSCFLIKSSANVLKTKSQEDYFSQSEISHAFAPNVESPEFFKNTEKRGILHRLWGRIKVPLQQIGKQTILTLGDVAAMTIHEAAETAVGQRRRDVDNIWIQKVHELTNIMRMIAEMEEMKQTQKSEARQGIKQTTPSNLDKRNIFEDFFKSLKVPLQIAGEKSVQALVGVLLSDLQHHESAIGKRNVFDVWQRFTESLKAAAKQTVQLLTEEAQDILHEAVNDAKGREKRNAFNETWNKIISPLEQIGLQMTLAIVEAASELLSFNTNNGRRDIWSEVLETLEKPLNVIEAGIGDVLALATGTDLTNVVSDVVHKRSDSKPMLPVKRFVFDLVNSLEANLKDIETKAKSDVNNVKNLISKEMLSKAEKNMKEKFNFNLLSKKDLRRHHPEQLRLPNSFKHLAKMYGITPSQENIPLLAKHIIKDAIVNSPKAVPHKTTEKLNGIIHLLSKFTK